LCIEITLETNYSKSTLLFKANLWMMNYTKSILKNNEKKGKKKQLYMHDEYKTRELLTK